MHSFDLCIIGAGPAGLLAGIIAASAGSRVILLEKNPEAGKKLLLTGKGRCNLTHAASSAKEITEAFGKNGRFLHSGLSRFGIAETFRFFENLGIPLKVERGNRVFPESGSAKDVRDRLLEEFSRKGGVFRMNCPVHALETSPRMVNRVLLKDKSVIEASRFIIATGGLSYPRTGSTGDGYRWAKTLGHTINPTLPALSPVRLAEGWVREVSGLSLKNVRLTLLVDGKETESRFGELDFTPFGISGPIGMDLSRNIGYALNQQQKTELKLDLKPALDFKSLDRRILRELNVAGS
jgi:predicted Rossmann fold flavoprotein